MLHSVAPKGDTNSRVTSLVSSETPHSQPPRKLFSAASDALIQSTNIFRKTMPYCAAHHGTVFAKAFDR